VINVAKLNMNSEIKNVEKRLQKAIESNDPILREVISDHCFR
jgi:heptaprenyl diphosphate synthase